MTVRIEITGEAELRAALRRAASRGPDLLDRALYEEATLIFNESQRLVPVRDGILQGSGVVEGPRNNEVLIGYGGAAASYALRVHEDLEARHAPGRTAKYLERPFNEAQTGLQARLAQRVLDRLDS